MKFTEEWDREVRPDEPLGPRVWLGIGGPARFFAEPESVELLRRLATEAKAAGLAVRILGDGSNLLVREAGVDGLVLRLAAATGEHFSRDGQRVTVGAGAKLSHAVMESVAAGLAGLEHLVGIPGTVGGAVVGNVSADGRDIGSVVESVEVMNADASPRTIPQEEIGFSHRKSTLTGLTVLAVTFALEPADEATLTKRMQKLWIGRNASRSHDEQRVAMPFIDPDGMPAAELIRTVGMAGVREGAVSLDPQPPHYLVAEDGATSDQCLGLIERVREQVLLQTGIDLQLNLQIW